MAVKLQLNTVAIAGNLTQDPELTTLPSGAKVCRMRVANNTGRKQPDGSWGAHTNYFTVEAWGNAAEGHNRFLSQGREINVHGRLEREEYQDREGNRQESYKIIADFVQYLASPSGGANANGGSDQRPAQTPPAQRPAAPVPSWSGGRSDPGDDVPF